MQEIILAKYGEMALKGLNKNTFEDILIKNIRRRLKGIGKFSFSKHQSTLYIIPESENADINEAFDRLTKVFGIAAVCKAVAAPKDFDAVAEKTIEYLEDTLSCANTFKVAAKRADKSFPMKSPEICRELGGIILSKFDNLEVDVVNPEITVTVEIRDENAYIHAENVKGAGGLPVGSSGKAMVLMSGGIDSPVAAYMMAKRGIHISAVHFESPPYTSERARLKVEELCRRLTPYCGTVAFFCVPFTEMQKAIKDNCPSEYFTIIMRRFMMKIAQQIAEKDECLALITGESVGQVASQTLKAMACTDAVCNMPVFRPLVGMDKTEIVEISRKIDTFETSILPYEDCCTVFTPKHPKTKPSIEEIENAEAEFDFTELLAEAVKNTTMKLIKQEN